MKKAKLFGVKISRHKCVICGLKFGVGEIIWGLIFLVWHCPSHFLSIKFCFRSWAADYLGFEKIDLIIWGGKKGFCQGPNFGGSRVLKDWSAASSPKKILKSSPKHKNCKNGKWYSQDGTKAGKSG